MPKKAKSVIVTVTDEAVKDINGLAKRLSDEGFKIDRVMPITGVISGSCPAIKMATLEKMDGVMSVEEELTVHLAPPDSPIQ